MIWFLSCLGRAIGPQRNPFFLLIIDGMTRNKKASDVKSYRKTQGAFSKMQTRPKWSFGDENKGDFLDDLFGVPVV
jgi:hypothetical protein